MAFETGGGGAADYDLFHLSASLPQHGLHCDTQCRTVIVSCSYY